jgi:hypothetical protein
MRRAAHLLSLNQIQNHLRGRPHTKQNLPGRLLLMASRPKGTKRPRKKQETPKWVVHHKGKRLEIRCSFELHSAGVGRFRKNCDLDTQNMIPICGRAEMQLG